MDSSVYFIGTSMAVPAEVMYMWAKLHVYNQYIRLLKVLCLAVKGRWWHILVDLNPTPQMGSNGLAGKEFILNQWMHVIVR